jgi:hypothetical protein
MKLALYMYCKNFLFVTVLLFACLSAFSQVNKNISKAIAVHIPKDYQILNTTTGNLNMDKLPDVIVVLKSPQEDTATDMEHPIRRPLLILFGNTNNTYTLAFRNDKTVYCSSCGGVIGDPFTGISIKNGYFTVEHYGGSSWRWTNYITFKFNLSDKHFYLHRIDATSFHASEPERVERKVETKKDFGTTDFINYDAKYEQ